MNYMQLLSSLFSMMDSKKMMKLFKRKRNNKGWIWISIIGITLISVFGSRNRRVNQEVQKRFQQAKNSVQSSFEVKRNPFDVNFNIATEIAKEINPDFEIPSQFQKK